MAEVFAGSSIGDHGFQKPVAIKRLLPELANDHVFVERLISEAKLLVGMQHGNIVSVLDLARDGDDVFLVMEFVDGPSLRQLLKARGQRGLPVGVATYIVQAAAAGLEFAHARPGGAVIHADISPSNLLLTTSGEVRVADFGIARREGGGHGIVEGKWAYMAPEQARGEPLTPRSDVFALGVVLYELICGAHPFGRQVTAEERDSEPLRVIPPRVVKPTIPHGIDAICMRALAHDPRERYARMQQMIDAIVEERFANQWREGASDLAQAIRECTPQSAAQQPRTMVTDRPLTIVTKSLIKELTPRRASSPRLQSRSNSKSRSQSQSESEASSSAPPSMVADSGARTTALLIDQVVRGQMFELPAMLRADGTPMPPFKLGAKAVAGQDLASVIGGHTVTGASAHVASAVVERGSSRWAIGVLAVAAVIGVIAAVVIQMGDGPVTDETAQQVFTAPKTNTLPPPESELQKDLTKVAPSISPPPETAKPPVAPVDVKPPVDDKPPVDPGPPTRVDQTPVDPPTGTPTPPTNPTPPNNTPRVVKPKKEGILRVQSEPWSWVSIAGQKRVDTPAKFNLAPGKYAVRFYSDDTKRSVTKYAVVESGKTTILTANLGEDD